MEKEIKPLAHDEQHALFFTRTRFFTAFGDGLYFVVVGLFLLERAGFSPITVGVLLAISAAAAALAGLWGGYAMHALPLRAALCALPLLSVIAIAAFPYLESYAPLVLACVIFRSAQRISFTIQSALIPLVVSTEYRVNARARVQRSSNIGLALGAAVGGLLISGYLKFSYEIAFTIIAISYVCSSAYIYANWKILILSGVTPENNSQDKLPSSALRDFRFISFTILFSVLLFNVPLIDLVLPVWIVASTNAPKWTISVVLIINTIVVIILQVKASNYVKESGKTAFMLLGSAYFTALSFIFFMLTGMTDWELLTFGFLIVAASVQAIGEVVQFSAGWDISYRMTPNNKHGQYQGIFALALPLAEVVAPLLMVSVITANQAVGWLVFAIMFIFAGHLIYLVTKNFDQKDFNI